jgi:hypothetical protein
VDVTVVRVGMGESASGPFVFVSYAEADRAWAEWLAWHLEAHGVAVRSYGWDAVPGSNRVRWLDRTTAAAVRAFIVLSQAYLDAEDAAVQWQAMFEEASNSVRSKIVPVRVGVCKPAGLLGEGHRVPGRAAGRDRRVRR